MAGEVSRQYVWDSPTRLFHWLIVGLFAFSWWSAENGHMDWHYLSGITMFGLLAFRLIWGVIGTDTARFAHFVRGPRAVRAYLRGQLMDRAGHNPLGGWSVLALLALLCIQVGSGLFAVDVDGIESGPLSGLVDFDQGRMAAEIHRSSFNILLGLIALHIVAILAYLLMRRQNLIGTMITGYRRSRVDAADAHRAGWVALLIAVAVAALSSWWIAHGARF